MSPRDRKAVFTAVAVAATLVGLVSLADAGRAGGSATASAANVAAPAMEPRVPDTTIAAAGPTTTAAPAGPTTTELPDLDGEGLTAAASCTMKVLSLRQGETNESVKCLQQALADAGYYTGPISGAFDSATFQAVERLQAERKLYVDGVVGRETALSLAIWPDEESLVIRTPKPRPGAKDLMGYPLSSVAVSGPAAPPLPPNSGSGKRLVYDRAGQRVWAVGADNRVIRSWLVAGSKYSNELPGVHEVYSKSEVSTAWNGQAYLPKMVRWLKTQKGAIGFHGIPTYVATGKAYMTEAELGTRLSGGCQRQANADAAFVWDFADIGTKVVVI